MGVCEACLHQAHKLVPVEQFNHKPMGMYDGGLLKFALGEMSASMEFVLQWHKVSEIGGDELHRPLW